MDEVASSPEGFEGRLGTLLSVAAAHHAPIPLEELTELLPPGAPADAHALGRWIREHPGIATVADGHAVAPGGQVRDPVARRDRADLYLTEARYVSTVALAPLHPLLRTLAVTGSTAYGLADQEDDLDFMAVTRPGGLWIFLTYAYLAARFRRAAPSGLPGAVWCFNYVLDEVEARREFTSARGLLFAREALTARPLLGAGYYSALIGASPGIRAEVPRLHARRAHGVHGDLPSAYPAPLALRALNAFIYPFLAAYLQVAGLYRNARLRRRGEGGQRFRVVTELRRMALETARFDELGSSYARTEGL